MRLRRSAALAPSNGCALPASSKPIPLVKTLQVLDADGVDGGRTMPEPPRREETGGGMPTAAAAARMADSIERAKYGGSVGSRSPGAQTGRPSGSRTCNVFFACGVDGGLFGLCGDWSTPRRSGTLCPAARSFWSIAAPPRVRGMRGKHAPCQRNGRKARSNAVQTCERITGSREKRSTDQPESIADRRMQRVGGGTEAIAAESVARVC